MMTMILYGHQACGKTYFGNLLAKKLEVSFIDTDHLIEAEFGISCRQIVKKWGEPFFREVEAQTIQSLSIKAPSIIAVGGGAVLNEENYLKLKSFGVLVYLELEKHWIKQRCFANGLPSYLESEDCFDRIYEERRLTYEKLSPYKVSLSGKSDSQILEDLKLHQLLK